jgi:hypothetical protein
LPRAPDTAAQDTRTAFAIAEELKDPALILRAALACLQVEHDVSVVPTARAARARILASLPESSLRERFFAATSEWF